MRVQRGPPPDHPACPNPAYEIKRPRHEIQALQCRLLLQEVPTSPDSPPVAGIDQLNRARGADHPAAHGPYSRNSNVLRPKAALELDDREIPLGSELFELHLHRLPGVAV